MAEDGDSGPKFIMYVEAHSFEIPASDIWMDPDEMPDNPSAEDAIERIKKDFNSPSEVMMDMNLLEGASINVNGGAQKGVKSVAWWDPEDDKED